MGRRKQYMDDGDDSSDEEGGRISFDITDRDLEEEFAGFSGTRTKPKRRRFGEEDDDDDDDMEPQRGGLGSSFTAAGGVNFQPAQKTTGSPTAPAVERVKQRERTRTPSPSPSRPSEEFGKFNMYGTGFGKKMLEKMGWRAGEGLGASGTGIVNPIETKLRPTRMGMGFRGFDERTEQVKEEARMRGDLDSDDEDAMDTDGPITKQKQQQTKREAWKKKARPPKTVFKTASQIIAETEMQKAPPPPPTAQKVIDMTGPSVREISLSDLRPSDSPTWYETTTRLPELRHNLRLIVDLSRGNLENLSREKQANRMRFKSLNDELASIKARMVADAQKKSRLEEIKGLAETLKRISKDALASGGYEQGNINALFGSVFDQLQNNYMDEVSSLNLDALVVSVWAPVLKYKSIHWDVLSNPTWGVEEVTKWRYLLRCNVDQDEYPSTRTHKEQPRMATPFEMMMNTIWLAKVRSAINNQWDVRDPDPIVQLLEAWKPLLPRFIFENIVDQLVLPKIVRAISDWDPRNDPEMVHTWTHPWLPVLGAWRLAEVFTSILHKISVALRQWHPSDESALHIISPWKDVWTPSQMESFLTKAVLPKLTQVLRHEFLVNPRDQQLEPLVWCLAWRDFFSPVLMGQLLENEFFNKWLDVLYSWLTLDRSRINYDEVRQWYTWWKQLLTSYGLDTNTLVAANFRKGLDMMSAAVSGEPISRH